MEPSDVPTIVPGRACGSCAMCCKLTAIPELQKPLGVWCKHVALGKGCTIYDDRPQRCRAFYCLWLQDRALGPEWKPDRAKFMLYLQGNSANIQVAVDQSFPNAWRKEPYYGALKRWSSDGAEQGRFVFVRVGARLFVLLPDRDADIGEVREDDDVVVSRKFTPAGYEYAVQVVARSNTGV